MGYMRHHAILVTGSEKENADEAHREIEIILKSFDMKLEQLLTPVQCAVCNGYASFAILPDGSKEDWDTSDAGDEARDKIIDYLKETLSVMWVELQYGDDRDDTRIVRYSDDSCIVRHSDEPENVEHYESLWKKKLNIGK